MNYEVLTFIIDYGKLYVLTSLFFFLQYWMNDVDDVVTKITVTKLLHVIQQGRL